MENTLIFSQIFFNFVVATGVLAVCILFSVLIYNLVNITKQLKLMIQEIHDFTDETQEKISNIIESLSELPILSFFLKKRDKSKIGIKKFIKKITKK